MISWSADSRQGGAGSDSYKIALGVHTVQSLNFRTQQNLERFYFFGTVSGT